MTDGHDELELLKRANPIPSSTAADDELAALAARIERITMDTQQDPGTSAIGEAPDSRAPRRRLAMAIGGVAAALLAVVGAVALTGGDGDDDVEAASPSTTVEQTPIDPAGGTSMMCAEIYSLETLAARTVAFDGTLESVDGDTMTFEVNEWFNGGEGDTASIDGASTIGSFTSIGDTIELEPGTRMLVAGDEQFAWSCGFTQPHDPAVADEWRGVFSG
jgi:hypothetical protein